MLGVLADLGIHKTDLIQFLLGDDIVRVSATIKTLDKKYPDGTPITVDDNALCPVSYTHLDVYKRQLRRQASAASASFVENGSAATAPTRPAYPIRASARNSAA